MKKSKIKFPMQKYDKSILLQIFKINCHFLFTNYFIKFFKCPKMTLGGQKQYLCHITSNLSQYYISMLYSSEIINHSHYRVIIKQTIKYSKI